MLTNAISMLQHLLVLLFVNYSSCYKSRNILSNFTGGLNMLILVQAFKKPVFCCYKQLFCASKNNDNYKQLLYNILDGMFDFWGEDLKVKILFHVSYAAFNL